MHELAIMRSVITGIEERIGAARVVRVVLEVGALCGTMAEAMRFCFEACSRATALEGATLEIVELPGRARCRACGSLVELPDLLALCRCGSANLELLSGRELKIKEVEVV
jgi:hydrogenase nickel incorporation protein HypA/HybF